MKKFLLACFLAVSAFAFCDTAPREAWLSFQVNFKKPLVYGYCYGLQDSYSSFVAKFPTLGAGPAPGSSGAELEATRGFLKDAADRSVLAMQNIDAFIKHVDAICRGKFQPGALPKTASIQEILRFALTTFQRDF